MFISTISEGYQQLEHTWWSHSGGCTKHVRV